jgi:integrase
MPSAAAAIRSELMIAPKHGRRREITVRWSCEEGKGIVRLKGTKNEQTRAVDAPSWVSDGLKVWKARQTEYAAVLKISRDGPQWHENDLVIPHETGGLKRVSVMSSNFTKWLRGTGLPMASLHELRHTYATTLLQHAVTLIIVSRLLGHRDVKITAQVYGHVLAAQNREASTTLDAIFKAT